MYYRGWSCFHLIFCLKMFYGFVVLNLWLWFEVFDFWNTCFYSCLSVGFTRVDILRIVTFNIWLWVYNFAHIISSSFALVSFSIVLYVLMHFHHFIYLSYLLIYFLPFSFCYLKRPYQQSEPVSDRVFSSSGVLRKLSVTLHSDKIAGRRRLWENMAI